MCPSCSSWTKAAAAFALLLLLIFSVQIEGLCFNKGNKGH
jgi:hypothetical protein